MAELESIDGLPVWHPPIAVLELAELVTSGALNAARAELLVTLPDELAGEPVVVLEDAEGTPVARYAPGAGFTPLRPFTHGPARAARRTPAEVRAGLAATGSAFEASAENGPVVEGGPLTEGGPLVEGGGTERQEPAVVVPVSKVWSAEQVQQVFDRVIERGRPVVWLGVVGAGRKGELPAAGLARAVHELAETTWAEGGRAVAALVAVPESVEAEEVARAYAPGGEVLTAAASPGGRPHPAFATELARATRDPKQRGVTVFFTGLSGSGKSTVAKALAERIEAVRPVSLLDGDEVRRLLSAGLGFSRADRDLNIRRIGFVAAEVTRHGGMAICAPIAPFDQVRRQVRAEVEENGDFVLVHVSTSLEECERRDRKGLYAKARQGIVKDFTGISSPYEIPADPELSIDTERITVAQAVDRVWDLLAARGYLETGERSARAPMSDH